MSDKNIFITINHLDDYNGLSNLKVGDNLSLIKDKDNPYDDEAIAIYNKDEIKVGYVANSVDTVARGTYSAGRLYDRIKDRCLCEVVFIVNDILLAMIKDK